MSVTYADDQTKMRVNGNALELTRWETIAAWAIAPNEESVVLASRFAVRKFGVNGKEWGRLIRAVKRGRLMLRLIITL